MIEENKQSPLQQFAAHWALEVMKNMEDRKLKDVQDIVSRCFMCKDDMVFIWTADNTEFIKEHLDDLSDVAAYHLEAFGRECVPCIFNRPHEFVNFIVYETIYAILRELDDEDEDDEPKTLLSKAVNKLKQFLDK